MTPKGPKDPQNGDVSIPFEGDPPLDDDPGDDDPPAEQDPPAREE